MVGAILLALAYGRADHHTPLDPTLILQKYRIFLSPKPTERATFLTLGFVVPLVALFAALRPELVSNSSRTPYLIWLLPITMSALFALGMSSSEYGAWLVPNSAGVWLQPLIWIGPCALASWAFFKSGVSRPQKKRDILARILPWTLSLGATALQIAAWRVANETSVTLAPTWWVSFDAVIYPLTQVARGRTLLVDLPSQYGLFPELIAPVFKVFGLSVWKFTTFCAVLQISSLGAIFFVASRLVRQWHVRAALALALVMVTFETPVLLHNIDERYFQYWPIRFLWPAMSLLAFHRFSIRPDTRRLAVVSLVSAIGTLWNLDSGLMIAISLAAYLAAQIVVALLYGDSNRHTTCKRLVLWFAVHIGILVVGAIAMLTYLTLKSHNSVNLLWIFEYQKLFYGIGLMMLPMPLVPSPWMAMLAVYLAGMMSSVVTWRTFGRTSTSDTVFFLSFLGLGLFVYYEGRSHILNLITVAWPALLLTVILADRLARAVRARVAHPANRFLAATGMGVVLYLSVAFLQGIPAMMKGVHSSFEAMRRPASSLVADELAFIRGHSTPGEKCVILSRRQGIYYASAGLASPLRGPGYAELLTTADRDSLLSQLASGEFSCVFVGLGQESQFEIGVDVLDSLKGYAISAKSPMGSMIYLRPSGSSSQQR